MKYKKINANKKQKQPYLAPTDLSVSQSVLDLHWQNGDYEKLDHLLKNAKKKQSPSWVENSGKLAFLQAKSKATNNIPGFISLVLTGGGCVITQHPLYQTEIKEAIAALGNELKLLFSQLQVKTSWDLSLIHHYIDYEANTLTEVLQQRIGFEGFPLDITPSPGYFITHHGKNGPLSQTFWPWLLQYHHDITALYQAEMQRIVLWVLGGDKLSQLRDSLAIIQPSTMHPYLRLAILLKAESIKPGSFTHLVQASDFKQLNDRTTVFKKIAIQTAGSLLNGKETLEFRTVLMQFSQVLPDPVLEPNTQLKQSMLSKSNPFTTLNIALTDSKPIILQKLLQLIQQSPENMASLRQAQNEVFNTAQRFLHHYLRFINYEAIEDSLLPSHQMKTAERLHAR